MAQHHCPSALDLRHPTVAIYGRRRKRATASNRSPCHLRHSTPPRRRVACLREDDWEGEPTSVSPQPWTSSGTGTSPSTAPASSTGSSSNMAGNGGKCPLRCNRQDGPMEKCRLDRRAHQRGGSPYLCLGQQANAAHRFLAAPAPHLASQHNQPTPPGRKKLRLLTVGN